MHRESSMHRDHMSIPQGGTLYYTYGVVRCMGGGGVQALVGFIAHSTGCARAHSVPSF
jgi:hypothetical protein